MSALVPNQLQARMVTAALAGRPIIAVEGGVGSGKTTGTALALDALDAARGGVPAGWVMDTYPRAKRVTIPTAQFVLSRLGWEPRESGMLWVSPRGGELRMVNYVTSTGSDGGQLEGASWSHAAIDECQDLPPSALDRVAKRCGRAPGKPGPSVVILTGLPQWEAWWTARARSVRGSVAMRASTLVNTALGEDYTARLRSLLSADEYEEAVNVRPRPPTGQVLRGWRPTAWPGGNVLEVDPGAYRGQDVTVAVDFGLRRPAAALIVQDAARELDVIVDDIQPDEVEVWDFAAAVAARIRHRGLRLSRVVGDPAGKQRSAMSLESQAQAFVAALRGQLGACPPMLSTTEPERRAIPAGISTLARLIESADGTRRFVVTRELWDRDGIGRTIRKCVLGYRYRAGSDEPKKDGETDHLIDALRYWAVNMRWTGVRPQPVTRDLDIAGASAPVERFGAFDAR